ncbi:unnamed protein product [Linum trigynum]|uniref:Uncharacterized protein n=1 Tax=Linum trigynum TaxID=586398 RepID=A0AAV2FL53_9ROSI
MDPPPLHIVFLPFMAQGHMIPITDMARLFARRGVKSTIITTPLNASLFSGKIRRDAQLGLPIETHIIEFPCAEAGLPDCENVNAIKSPELTIPFFKSMAVFQRPVEDLLRQWRPDCIVADVFFTWATETADRLCIPMLFFNGTGAFAVSLLHALKLHEACSGEEWRLERRRGVTRGAPTASGCCAGAGVLCSAGWSRRGRRFGNGGAIDRVLCWLGSTREEPKRRHLPQNR